MESSVTTSLASVAATPITPGYAANTTLGLVGTFEENAWTLDDLGTANLLAVDGPVVANLYAVGWGGIYGNSTGTWEYQDVATGRRFNDCGRRPRWSGRGSGP